MYSIIKTIFLLILLFQAINVFSQNKYLEPYLNIKPFYTTRDDVLKIYGEGKFPKYNPYTVWYKTDDLTINVSYSSGGCEKKYSLYDIPEWTVEEISYDFLKTPPRLKDLIKNNKKFKKTPYGDGISQMKYYDEESGITIYFDKFTKEVEEISIGLTLKDKQKFDCDNLKK